MTTWIKNNSTVLFQGDSITDCGRNRDDFNSLGHGYAMMVAAFFSATFPEKNVTFINRGISGDRVVDLQERWQQDCIELQPDYLSILIGINDCWRRYDGNDPTSVEKYQAGYHQLLTEAREKTTAEIILLEPFVLPVPKDREAWREDLDPKIQAVRQLAREFQVTYIPLDGIFNSYAVAQPPSFWAEDGVHPSMAGHALIAKQWLKATAPASL